MYMEGVFFYWSAQISVLKRKTLFNQQRSFVNREFHGTESLIGCPSFFILVLKFGRNSWKNHPVVSWISQCYYISLTSSDMYFTPCTWPNQDLKNWLCLLKYHLCNVKVGLDMDFLCGNSQPVSLVFSFAIIDGIVW